MEMLVSLLGTVLPYIVGLIGIIAVYLGIKHKGVTEERTRQEEKHFQEVAKVQNQVQKAASQDIQIDKKVENEIKKVDEVAAPQPASSPDKFRF